jgi:RNA polymerase sigma-70 factor, ECF subfamily
MAILNDDEFESLVRRHEAMLCRIAYNFLRSASLAEEIVQDVFLKSYVNLAKMESPEHLKAWLRRAVTHRCIDLARSGKAQKELQLDELPDVVVPILERDPLLSEHLRRLVAALPETQRMVVILRYAEDMDSEDIGEILDMPASTVRTHLQRAIAVLREKARHALGEDFHGPIRNQSS